MGVQIPLLEGAILRGEGASHCKVQGHAAVICAKMAEPIQIPFGLRTLVGPMNHILDGGLDAPMGRGNFGVNGRPL